MSDRSSDVCSSGLAGLLVEKNGEPVATGVGAAVQGSPLNSVAWLANTLGRLGMPFRAGEVILSGSLSPLVPVADGDTLIAHIGGIGRCSVSFAHGGRSEEHTSELQSLMRISYA